MNKKYENELTFKVFLMGVKRKFMTILYFIICFTVIGAVYGSTIGKPSYKTTGSLGTKNSMQVTSYSTLLDYAKECTYLVYDDLKAQGITHSDGTEIRKSEIDSGLGLPSVPSVVKSLTVEFSYTNKDKAIVKDVLSSILNNTVTYANEHTSTYISLELKVAIEPSEPVATSSLTKKIIIFTVCGAILGTLIAVFKEWKNYAINDASDLAGINTNVFEIEYKGGKRHE